MPVDAVNNTREITDAAYKTTSTRNTGQLGKDDFLRLLVTQLQYQDPLNPMDDKEFIAQMAQFSSLEQMQNLNSTFSSMKGLNMVGKYVVAKKYDSESSNVKIIEGVVKSAKIEGGNTYLDIGEETVSVNDVTEVRDSISSDFTNLSTYAQLLGHKATGYLRSLEDDSYVKVTGTIKQLEKGYYVDYAVMDGVGAGLFEVISEIALNSTEDIKNYLESSINNEVTLKIKNDSSDGSTKVTALLRSIKVNDNNSIEVELDNVYVPVDSITKLMEES